MSAAEMTRERRVARPSLRPVVALLSMLVRRASDAASGSDGNSARQQLHAALPKVLRLGYVPWILALQFAGGALFHTAAANCSARIHGT